MSWCALLPLNANAALSATTVNTIQGTKPYLTFDEGKARAIDTKTLLSLTLSDGTMYTQDNNSSSVSNPIVLPVSGRTINDVKLFVPEGKSEIKLSDLIGAPYYHWGEDDGDGLEDDGIKATGNLSVTITDIDNKLIEREGVLDPCYAPYTVTLKATDGALSTQYGDPRVTDFNASSVIYYISPKTDTPYACFAKPNLNYNYGTQPEWDGNKGFKLQSLSDPKKNFPRTGFHGAFFDIAIEKATAESIISATGNTITQGGVTATLTAQSTNVVRITLTGPKNPSGGAFTPSTFTIKSNSTDAIYSFALSKWFVSKPGKGGGYSATQNYCRNLMGGYRVPSVSEYTNANSDEYDWVGLPGWGQNTYARSIGNGKQKTAVPVDDSQGGLFAEWGYTDNSYYTTSDFESKTYWAIEPYGDFQRGVRWSHGNINYNHESVTAVKVACVIP